MRRVGCVLRILFVYVIIGLISTQLIAVKPKPDGLHESDASSSNQAKKRVLLTNESAQRLMDKNKLKALERIKAHIDRLQWAITNNKLNEHDIST